MLNTSFRIALGLISCALFAGSVLASEPPLKITIRAVVSSAKNAEKLSVKVNGVEEELFVQNTPIITEGDLFAKNTTLAPEHMAQGPSLEIPLTVAGQKKLEEWSESNIGHRVAIFVDGSFVSAPMIVEPLKSTSFRVFGLDGVRSVALFERLTGRSIAIETGQSSQAQTVPKS